MTHFNVVYKQHKYCISGNCGRILSSRYTDFIGGGGLNVLNALIVVLCQAEVMST